MILTRKAKEVMVSSDNLPLQAHLDGDWHSAEKAYRERLKNTDTPSAHLLGHLGVVLRKQGKSDEALAFYREAVTLEDANETHWFNLGNALFDQKNWQQAETCFIKALQQNNRLEAAALQLARCSVNLNAWQIARERFAEVLRGNPNNFSAWLESGHLCRQHGTELQMIKAYQQAVAVAPERYAGHVSLARGLTQTGHHDAAAVHYYLALQCEDAGDGLEVHTLMGRSRLELGLFAGAVEAFSSACSLANNDYRLLVDLAESLHHCGDRATSDALFHKVMLEGEVNALSQLADVLYRCNEWQQSEMALRRAAKLSPESWQVHFNLGRLLVDTFRTEQGIEALSRAEQLSGEMSISIRGIKAKAIGKQGDSRQAFALHKALIEDDPSRTFISAAAMTSLYDDSLTAQQMSEFHCSLFSDVSALVRDRLSFNNQTNSDRMLRIGYVTADMHHQHPVDIFMQPVLTAHDKSQFDITVYHVGNIFDEETEKAQSKVSRWRNVGSMSDQRLARIIEADGIDILVDLLGHTSHSRPDLFNKRAAPVQVSYLGYPSTTGIPAMDWLIADDYLVPAGKASLYSEQVFHLPHSVFCFASEQDFPYPEYNNEHKTRALTFGSFNSVAKLSLKTVELWASVLKAAPKSRLLLKAPQFADETTISRYRRLFTEQGIDEQRIEYRGPTALAEMMAEYAEVDIALDPTPYGGGTTSLQALWMGVPLVTLKGDNFSQCMGSSILSALGKEAWVANDEQEFVKIAIKLTKNRQALLKEKQQLRQLMLASDAHNINLYTAALEKAYQQMWQDWCIEKSNK
jgi:protein O-GlcNAc transferase